MYHTEEKIREYQKQYYGPRYEGASLSRIRQLPENAAGSIKQWIENPKRSLVIVGPPGTGKTYMTAAILEVLLPKIQYFRIYKEYDLFRKLRNSFSDSSSGDFMDYLKFLIDDDLIIIDDIGSSGHTEWREDILFAAIENRDTLDKPTIYTSNLTREDFKKNYNERIASRLFATSNCVIDFSGMPDLRQQGL